MKSHLCLAFAFLLGLSPFPLAHADLKALVGAVQNRPAPPLATLDANKKPRRLADLRGKKALLLTFFPRCFTGQCSTQLTSLREHYPKLQKAGVEVWAVSTDPADGARGQRAFAKQLELPFPLLSDTDRKISLAFGAVQSREQMAARMSVFIDQAGTVRWVDKQINPRTHGTDVLARLKAEGLIPSGPKETIATPSPSTR